MDQELQGLKLSTATPSAAARDRQLPAAWHLVSVHTNSQVKVQVLRLSPQCAVPNTAEAVATPLNPDTQSNGVRGLAGHASPEYAVKGLMCESSVGGRVSAAPRRSSVLEACL